jgi:uncharacterized membrane protein YeaQ/YmgE (transglycosylase-associated protein family)
MRMEAWTRQDDRAARRDLAGVVVGGLVGLVMGLLVGSLWMDGEPVGRAMVVVAGMLGAAAGAVLGRSLAHRISADEVEPRGEHRPFVGAHSPDDDGDEGVAR